MKLPLILILGFSMSVSWAQTVGPVDSNKATPPRTLLEAISTAVKRNPKTVAIDELIESIQFATKAVRASRLPHGNVNCSVTRDWSNSSYNGIRQHSQQLTTQSCGISASYTLYDGGATRNRIKAAQAGEAAAIASYNTADSHIENTRGGLANQTKEIFTSIAEMNAYREFYSDYLAVLYEFKKVGGSDNLAPTIVGVEQAIARFDSKLALFLEDFRYIVTVQPSPDLDGLEGIIESLKTIPLTADEAVRVATERGPEVIRRNLNVRMAEFNLKAEKASQGPFISLGAGVSQGQYRIKNETSERSTYRSASVGIHLTVPLDPSARFRRQQAEKHLASQISERQAALADAERSVRRTYASLESDRRLYLTNKKALEEQWALIRATTDRIARGDTSGIDVENMLTAMGILENRFSQLLMLQQNIIMSLFSVQQVTGLLFDHIDSQPVIQTVF